MFQVKKHGPNYAATSFDASPVNTKKAFFTPQATYVVFNDGVTDEVGYYFRKIVQNAMAIHPVFKMWKWMSQQNYSCFWFPFRHFWECLLVEAASTLLANNGFLNILNL